MYYFASDIHLGAGSKEQSRNTEKLFISWLDKVADDADAIFLCGDIFDFWFEYKRVVPKGFTRTLGKISELTDRGIKIIFICGNHDMWALDYLHEECGMEIIRKGQVFEIASKRVFVAHGDNLNMGKNLGLRLMNSTFRSNIVRWLFSRLIHPDLALKFGQWWSGSSRKQHKPYTNAEHKGVEILIDYAQKVHPQMQCDYYIFGHMHHAKRFAGDNMEVLMMNDWGGELNTIKYIELSNNGEAQLKAITDLQ